MATPEQIIQANLGAIQFQKQNESRLRTQYPESSPLTYEQLVQRERLDPRNHETTISSDNRTTNQRTMARKAFKREEQKVNIKHNVDNGSNFMSHTTDYIPVIGSVLRGGESQTREMIGDKEGARAAGTQTLMGGIIDLATFPFMFTRGGTQSLIGSWIGGEAGKYVGQKYDSPYLGQFIGTISGGFSPQLWKWGQNNVNKLTSLYQAGLHRAYFPKNYGSLNLYRGNASPDSRRLGKYIADQSESWVYEHPKNSNVVLKVNTGYGGGSLQNFVHNYIRPRNQVPYQLPLKLEGVTKEGFPVTSQRRITELPNKDQDFTQEQISQIVKMLQNESFDITPYKLINQGMITNGAVNISDIAPHNMGLDNGKLRFFDVHADWVK